ncbi:MAG: Rossmann-like fold-containing protein [Alphaproteobacteria bacterium]
MLNVIRNTVDAFLLLRLKPWQDLGDTLLIGEGNLSFAKSLIFLPCGITLMTATTFEERKDLSQDAKENAAILMCHSVSVSHGVNATHLEKSPLNSQYGTIIFQFPNVGSRTPKYGQNPNHVMIRKFLDSAGNYLSSTGRILITTVDSPHYEGVFRLKDASQFAGYKVSGFYPFDPKMFRGYSHANTLDSDSAIKNHARFITWVFEKDE